MSGIFSLPHEVFVIILDYLPVDSIELLAATCRCFYGKIHQDDVYWANRLRKKHELCVATESPFSAKSNVSGIVKDPLYSNPEALEILLCNKYGEFLCHKREFRLSTFLLSTMKRHFWSQRANEMDVTSRRLAIFGPAIESPEMRELVPRLAHSHDDCFHSEGFATFTRTRWGFVTGALGGVGSGVRVRFRHKFYFDLICLYSNVKSVRQGRQDQRERLLARSNKLLRKDVILHVHGNTQGGASTPNDDDSALQSNVLSLMSTLEGLIYAINISDANINLLRRELETMLQEESPLPLLILCCSCEEANIQADFQLPQFASDMGLLLRCNSKMQGRPWGMFKVNVRNMLGLEPAFTWLMHHLSS